jgi:hypothetical protein
MKHYPKYMCITILKLKLCIVAIYMSFCFNFTSAFAAGAVYTDVPEVVKVNQKYLFYMHGGWIEKYGIGYPHPSYGYYEYEKIVRAFAERGFIVISEMRLHKVQMYEYAHKIAGQVRWLLEKGVPARNITIIGHSKGGHMALMVASILEEDRVSFVIIAGCGREGTIFRRGYEKFLQRLAWRMKGRILSIYDTADEVAGTCQGAFDEAPQAESEEIVFHTGLGHGLFYSPRPVWIDEVIKWANYD